MLSFSLTSNNKNLQNLNICMESLMKILNFLERNNNILYEKAIKEINILSLRTILERLVLNKNEIISNLSELILLKLN